MIAKIEQLSDNLLQRQLVWERSLLREAESRWPHANHSDERESVRLMEHELIRRGVDHTKNRWDWRTTRWVHG